MRDRMRAAMRLDAVAVRYGRVDALRSVTLRIGAGERV